MPDGRLGAMPRQLRQSSMARGLGITELVKIQPSPAAGANFLRAVPGDYWERLLALTFRLTTSAAAASRLPVINFMDGDGFIFNQVPVTGGLLASNQLSVYADLATITPVQQPETVQGFGQVVSPAAGATIASIVLGPGGWQVSWQVEIEANGAAADDNNFILTQAAATVLQSASGHVAGQPYPQDAVDIIVPTGGQTIAVKALAIGTVTAVYDSQLAAVPLSQQSLQAQLPDFLMRSGWQLGVSVGGIQAADQIDQVALLVERFPSDNAAGTFHSYAMEAIEQLLHNAGA